MNVLDNLFDYDGFLDVCLEGEKDTIRQIMRQTLKARKTQIIKKERLRERKTLNVCAM